MDDNILKLSPPEVVKRFRDAAELLLVLNGELNESVHSMLQAKAEEMRLLPADFSRILDEIVTLPSMIEKFEEYRMNPLEYRLEHAEPEASIQAGISCFGSSTGTVMDNNYSESEAMNIYLTEQSQPAQENTTYQENKQEDNAIPCATEDIAIHFATEDIAIPFATEDIATPCATEDIAIPFATEDNAIPFATEDNAIPFATDDIDVVDNIQVECTSAGEFVFVKGGTFEMGSNEIGSGNPIHSVTLCDFYISKYEVTQKQWRNVMETNPMDLEGDELPVENVSWNDAQEFLQKLNENEGSMVYRLPTEAEWEYAARGGAKSHGYTYSGSNAIGDVAWFGGNSEREKHAIGTKQPNELGLYDMSGNMWEWCSDWYDGNYYRSSPSNNPQGPGIGVYRVVRGGSFSDTVNFLRLTCRSGRKPDVRNEYVGFRCAMNIKYHQ